MSGGDYLLETNYSDSQSMLSSGCLRNGDGNVLTVSYVSEKSIIKSCMLNLIFL